MVCIASLMLKRMGHSLWSSFALESRCIENISLASHPGIRSHGMGCKMVLTLYLKTMWAHLWRELKITFSRERGILSAHKLVSGKRAFSLFNIVFPFVVFSQLPVRSTPSALNIRTGNVELSPSHLTDLSLNYLPFHRELHLRKLRVTIIKWEWNLTALMKEDVRW